MTEREVLFPVLSVPQVQISRLLTTWLADVVKGQSGSRNKLGTLNPF